MMAKTALDLTYDERSLYRPMEAIERRRRLQATELEERWKKAQRIAARAAAILYKDYAASKVVLFGSAADRLRFTLFSDIDLAAWGIPPEKFFSAVAAVAELDEIRVDLVDPASCSESLLRAIEQEGRTL
jgi:predicted nucleotidyltransferase